MAERSNEFYLWVMDLGFTNIHFRVKGECFAVRSNIAEASEWESRYSSSAITMAWFVAVIVEQQMCRILYRMHNSEAIANDEWIMDNGYA